VKQREAPKRNSGRTSQFCRNRVKTLGQGSPIMAVLLLRHQALARLQTDSTVRPTASPARAGTSKMLASSHAMARRPRSLFDTPNQMVSTKPGDLTTIYTRFAVCARSTAADRRTIPPTTIARLPATPLCFQRRTILHARRIQTEISMRGNCDTPSHVPMKLTCGPCEHSMEYEIVLPGSSTFASHKVDPG